MPPAAGNQGPAAGREIPGREDPDLGERVRRGCNGTCRRRPAPPWCAPRRYGADAAGRFRFGVAGNLAAADDFKPECGRRVRRREGGVHHGLRVPGRRAPRNGRERARRFVNAPRSHAAVAPVDATPLSRFFLTCRNPSQIRFGRVSAHASRGKPAARARGHLQHRRCRTGHATSHTVTIANSYCNTGCRPAGGCSLCCVAGVEWRDAGGEASGTVPGGGGVTVAAPHLPSADRRGGFCRRKRVACPAIPARRRGHED
jgi:hypothetical protein